MWNIQAKAPPRNCCSKDFAKFRVNFNGGVHFRKAGKVFNFTKDRPLSTFRNLENLHSIYFLYTCSKLLVYYVMIRSFLLDTTVFSLYLFRWRHWEITSERLFNNISLGSSTISNFSCKRKIRLFELGCMIYICLLYSRISVGEVSYLPVSSIQ